MKISYKKLWIILLEQDIKKRDFRKITGLSTGTITKLNKNEPVSLSVLITICQALKCDIGDICSVIEDE
jgi:DNA-binding Xre family transcriptional regulator